MQHTIEWETEAIEQLSVAQLLEKYQIVFGKPATSRHRRHLVRQIAQGLQVTAEGGLTEKASRRAASLVDQTDLSVAAATKRNSKNRNTKRRNVATRRRGPLPGTVLVRDYQGRTLKVNVLEEGFEYEGQTFGSLTALTQAITGTHWNGYHFFKLNRKEKKNR